MIAIYFSTTDAAHLPLHMEDIDLLFPENHCGLPLVPRKLIDKMIEYFREECNSDKVVLTVSEYVVLVALHLIRTKQIPTHSVQFVWHGVLSDNPHQIVSMIIRHDSEGELVDKVPCGFFRERSELLF